MIVCIAEKPSVAREIAAVLGATKKMDGYLEGNGYQVTWTFGHLCTLNEPHDYNPQWKVWMLSALPVIPPRFGIKLIDNETYVRQFDIIKTLMHNADEIINCGDAGQEGELIQRWVMLKAGAKCPVRRLWISSLTEEAIREGFSALRPESDFRLLYEAGLARAIGDWILGINATRLYTLRYAANRQVLSIGRVQTPTLAMIVQRQAEIDNFVPAPYWELKTVYRDVVFTAKNGKFDRKEDGERLLEEVSGKDFTVTGISEKKGKEAPPRLFDLTSLQVECNRKYAFSADTTLRLVQSLYEKKTVTYPRVDTTFLSEDIYPKVPAILAGMKGYEDLVAPLKGRKLPKSKKVFDNSKVTDHHAIIPTGVSAANLSPDEEKVRDLVARRFIVAFYPDCEISTTTVTGNAGTVSFRTVGKQILKQGWRTVFPLRDRSQEDTPVLPEFAEATPNCLVEMDCTLAHWSDGKTSSYDYFYVPNSGKIVAPADILVGQEGPVAQTSSTLINTVEELAPGFKTCVSHSSSTLEMRECNANAIKYWQNRLDKELSHARMMCGQADRPDSCLERLNKSQEAWQNYVDMMAAYYEEVNGGSVGVLEQGYFRAEAIKAQVRILE